ncbi:uncharacterized protein LOC111629304 [Centruroides sculpturatus]|uniref:uncharacterized protein LOC111629304 n=1 Tax=Centruroides sculpturatus TaxID=218467 RepID=UPI000C6D4BC9|nr:uncharacterized protein LOC111629304 [Centruroides sculpturatus]
MTDLKKWIFANRLSLNLIICLLIIAGIESNPESLPRSPQQMSKEGMQKRGCGRPRKDNSKEMEKEKQLDDLMSEDYYQFEEDYCKSSLPATRTTKIHEYFETLRDTEPQFNIELQGIKTEVNSLKEENKYFQGELTKLFQKIEEMEEISKNNSQIKGMLKFEINKLVNERNSKNIIIKNFPFNSIDCVKEINQFIKEDLGITNRSIESLIRLTKNEIKPIMKISLYSLYVRNSVLKKFWKMKVNFNNEERKK